MNNLFSNNFTNLEEADKTNSDFSDKLYYPSYQNSLFGNFTTSGLYGPYNEVNNHNNYNGITSLRKKSFDNQAQLDENKQYKLFPDISNNTWQTDEQRNSNNDLKNENSPLRKINFGNNCDSFWNSRVCFFLFIKKYFII